MGDVDAAKVVGGRRCDGQRLGVRRVVAFKTNDSGVTQVRSECIARVTALRLEDGDRRPGVRNVSVGRLAQRRWCLRRAFPQGGRVECSSWRPSGRASLDSEVTPKLTKRQIIRPRQIDHTESINTMRA